jgi:hypothetical protein
MADTPNYQHGMAPSFNFEGVAENSCDLQSLGQFDIKQSPIRTPDENMERRIKSYLRMIIAERDVYLNEKLNLVQKLEDLKEFHARELSLKD